MFMKRHKTLSRLTAFVMLLCILLSISPYAAFADVGGDGYILTGEEVTDAAVQPAAADQAPAAPETDTETPPQEQAQPVDIAADATPEEPAEPSAPETEPGADYSVPVAPVDDAAEQEETPTQPEDNGAVIAPVPDTVQTPAEPSDSVTGTEDEWLPQMDQTAAQDAVSGEGDAVVAAPEKEDSSFHALFIPKDAQTGAELVRYSTVSYRFFDGVTIRDGDPVVLKDDALTIGMDPNILYEVTMAARDAYGIQYYCDTAAPDPARPVMLLWMDERDMKPVQINHDNEDDLLRDHPQLGTLLDAYFRECERLGQPDTYRDDVLKTTTVQVKYDYDYAGDREIAKVELQVLNADAYAAAVAARQTEAPANEPVNGETTGDVSIMPLPAGDAATDDEQREVFVLFTPEPSPAPVDDASADVETNAGDNAAQESDSVPEYGTEADTEDTSDAEADTSEGASDSAAEYKLGDIGDMVLSDMSIADLFNLDQDVAGAAMEQSLVMPVNLVVGNQWSFDVYYINEDNTNYTHKDSDFSLKYQMEFHASQNFLPGEVSIRIPAALFKDRDGNDILPTDIAVPKVTGPSGPTVYVRNSPFNYYVEADGSGVEYLVFFNYREITSGTNSAWQVVYSHTPVMKIVDQTAWSLQANVAVNYVPGGHDPDEPDYESYRVHENGEATPLSGDVDTGAVLSSIVKTPYTSTNGKSYCPGLYTPSQVQQFISGPLPAQYSGDNFGKYQYVVWEYRVRGNGSQPFDLWFRDMPDHEGHVVGYSLRTYDYASGYERNGDRTTSVPDTYDTTGDENLARLVDGQAYTNLHYGFECRDWQEVYYVVTAYDAGMFGENEVLTNTVEVVLVPADRKDPAQYGSASNTWNYVAYHWEYPGDETYLEKHSVPSGKTIYSGWLDVYDTARREGQDVASEFQFSSTSKLRSYARTHHTEEGEYMGQRIQGNAVRMVTVDDALYTYPNGTSMDNETMLDGSDYYFTQVSASITEYGYDVYEDNYAKPESAGPDEHISQDMAVYAMFANDGSGTTAATAPGDWTYVGTVSWADRNQGYSADTLTYTFSQSDLEKQPYRVMVVHDAINYEVSCTINVTVRIRHDSPKVNQLLNDNPDVVSVEFENVSGMSDQLMAYGEPSNGVASANYFAGAPAASDGSYIHSSSTSEYDDINGLTDFTNGLYGILLDRAAATVRGQTVGRNAYASKSATSANDAANGRVNVTYYVTAYDGYMVDSNNMANYLVQHGMQDPSRDGIVFYDLLPYGMKFDPSAQPVAGRITSLINGYQTQPRSWNQDLVSVHADVVSTNYKDTGRTMVAFHVSYNGTNTAAFYNGQFFEGWGVSFRGYWNWEDVAISNTTKNVCAVMPEAGDDKPFIAAAGQTYADDGTHPSGAEEDYKFFGPDIDGDGNMDAGRVMYAQTKTPEDVAMAFTSTITKTVRADSDKYGAFEKSAVVKVGGGYTYELTITNASRPITNIVVFDRLENAVKDRQDPVLQNYTPVSGEIEFDETYWTGTYASVITEGLEERGVDPTVYYNASRDAVLPVARTNPASVLTAGNGWYTKQQWEADDKSIADVQAIAVDMGGYTLDSMDSISFRVCMTAPDAMPEDAVWAYNNPSFYSEVIPSGGSGRTPQSVIGNSVKVRMGEPKNIEVIKEIANKDDAPDTALKQSFEFSLYEKEGSTKVPYANKEYRLYTLNGKDKWVTDGHIYATDVNGRLWLQDGQKALFTDIADVTRIFVEETENPFWATEMNEEDTDEVMSYRFTNTFRPVLYVRKTTSGVPDGYNISSDEFTFQAFINDEPARNVPYWFVDNAYTDGRLPNHLTDREDGVTDDQGYFTIHAGDIVALLGPGTVDDEFTVTETEPGDNWVCREDRRDGTLQKNGTLAAFTNYYKWKDLLLKKEVSSQSQEDAEKASFRFTVSKITTAPDGSDVFTPVTGLTWTLEVSGEETPTEYGVLDDDGSFTCHAAKGIVRIKGLEAEMQYQVLESLTDAAGEALDQYSQYYSPMNGGEADVSMPLFSSSSSAVIQNDWLKRPLAVSKTLIYDMSDPDLSEKAKTAVFEMKAESDTDGDGEIEVLKNYPFTLTQNGIAVEPGDSERDPYVVGGSKPGNTSFVTDDEGKFLLMNGQTATFQDAGVKGSSCTVTETPDEDFAQVYPVDGLPYAGLFDTSGDSINFINGSTDGIVISKDWVGDNDIGKEFIGKATGAGSEFYKALAIHLSMAVRSATAGPEDPYEPWPTVDTTVNLIDSEGNLTEVTWAAATASDPGGLDIHAGDTIAIISGLDDVAEYEVRETRAQEANDYFWCGGSIRDYKADDGKKYWLQVQQVVPDDGSGVISGTVEEAPAVTFTNVLLAQSEASEIYKRMTKGSTTVPDRSRLVFIVERYTEDGTWVPAGDVPYMLPTVTRTADDLKANISEGGLVTGPDGKITIDAWTTTYPYVVFVEHEVHILDVLEPVAGDMRIRELVDECDEEWGQLVGVGGNDMYDEYTMDLTKFEEHLENGVPVAAFVNSNTEEPVRIAKALADDAVSDAEFTMTLSQVTGIDGDKYTLYGGITSANYHEIITGTEVREGIPYVVYDSVTNSFVSSGVTGKNGEVVIKAGQYAELVLPHETMWTVSENVTPGFELKSMDQQSGADRLGKLADNLMLIGADAEWYKDKESSYDVKYAVSIYGIKKDRAGADKYANVTFGPATGANYVNSCKYCPGTSADAPGNCMHWMTWEEIADIAQNNPDLFQNCLANGCTHAVELKFEASDRILGQTYAFEMDDGDGASILYNSIGSNYHKWNNDNFNYGGWPASRIRAVLNGPDEYTADGLDVNTTNSKVYYNGYTSAAGTDMQSFTEAQALISAFPAELQAAIVPKAVKSDTYYSDYSTENHTFTTYDRLWLFSEAEINTCTHSSSSYVRDNEGLVDGTPYYARTGSLGWTSPSTSYSSRVGYNEAGSSAWWWLRSPSYDNRNRVCGVDYSGYSYTYSDAYSTGVGLAPGFCLGTSPAPVIRNYHVKYAVSIYGINQDVGETGDTLALTFGPATGGNYVNSFKSCAGSSEAEPNGCIHWMTWDEIIDQARIDPNAFQKCLDNGCTHSVEMEFTDTTILGTSYNKKMSGDGASILYNSIGSNYHKWNNDNFNYGGWPASRIRAVLNGPDEYTADGLDVNTTNSKVYYNGYTSAAGTDMQSFTEAQALISAFPAELQAAIVPKAVKSDTYYSDYSTENHTFTTYDRLWLFSEAEINTCTHSSSSYVRDFEGLTTGTPYYARTSSLGWETPNNAYSSRVGYTETGSSAWWWLRSPCYSVNFNVCNVYVSGYSYVNSFAYSTGGGLAPGFCIN